MGKLTPVSPNLYCWIKYLILKKIVDKNIQNMTKLLLKLCPLYKIIFSTNQLNARRNSIYSVFTMQNVLESILMHLRHIKKKLLKVSRKLMVYIPSYSMKCLKLVNNLWVVYIFKISLSYRILMGEPVVRICLKKERRTAIEKFYVLQVS